MAQHIGEKTEVTLDLKGDETFDELIQTKESDQGLGSLYPMRS